MIKSIINSIKSYSQKTVALAKAKHSILHGVYIPPLAGQFEGKDIYLHDNYVHACTGVPPHIPGVMFRVEGVIVINKAFLDLPEHIRTASIQHELGHIANRDPAPTNIEKVLYTLGLGKQMAREFAADEYALSKGEKILEAIEYFQQFKDIPQKPLAKRIARLKAISN